MQQLRAAAPRPAGASAAKLTIVAEVLDFLTFRVFQTEGSLLQSALLEASRSSTVLAFHRKHLEAATLCVSTQLPSLGHALEALTGLAVRRRGMKDCLRVQVHSRPVHAVIGDALPKCSFLDMVDRVDDGVVMGWVRSDTVEVNPVDKMTPLAWTQNDEVIVITAKKEALGGMRMMRSAVLPRLPSFEDTGRGED
jgi:hypothetical protein